MGLEASVYADPVGIQNGDGAKRDMATIPGSLLFGLGLELGIGLLWLDLVMACLEAEAAGRGGKTEQLAWQRAARRAASSVHLFMTSTVFTNERFHRLGSHHTALTDAGFRNSGIIAYCSQAIIVFSAYLLLAQRCLRLAAEHRCTRRWMTWRASTGRYYVVDGVAGTITLCERCLDENKYTMWRLTWRAPIHYAVCDVARTEEELAALAAETGS
jgi:hypothetical protein